MQHIQRMAQVRNMRQPVLLGYSGKGKPIYSIAGGADDGGEGSEGGEGEEGGEEKEEGSEGGEGGASGSEEGAGKSKSSDDEPVSREEFEAVMRRMKAADKRASEFEQKVQEYERKERSEFENLQADLEEKDKAASTLSEENQSLKMRLAVLTQAGNRFRDPEDVLRFVDYTDIASEDGDIDKKAVTKALEDLAEQKSYLLADTGGDGEEDEGEGKPPSTPPAGNGRKKTGIDREDMLRKYPALRR